MGGEGEETGEEEEEERRTSVRCTTPTPEASRLALRRRNLPAGPRCRVFNVTAPRRRSEVSVSEGRARALAGRRQSSARRRTRPRKRGAPRSVRGSSWRTLGWGSTSTLWELQRSTDRHGGRVLPEQGAAQLDRTSLGGLRMRRQGSFRSGSRPIKKIEVSGVGREGFFLAGRERKRGRSG